MIAKPAVLSIWI